MYLDIIHTADWHLGKNRSIPDYLKQQSYMLEGVVKQVRDKCAALTSEGHVWLLLSGDIFDRNEDTQREEFQLLLLFFIAPIQKLLEKYDKLEIFCIDGNHDRFPFDRTDLHAALVQGGVSVLSSLADVLPERFHLQVDTPRLVTSKTGATMLMVPFQNLTEKGLRSLIKEYAPNFVMAHECLARMETDTGYTPPRDQEKYLEIENVLADCQVSGIFLGDIHKCQNMDLKGVCWYSGSPITLDHGHKLPKGLLHHKFELDTDWVRSNPPNLETIVDTRIRTHLQLGLVTGEIVPNPCLNFEQHYIKLIVTPESYKVIDAANPEFFHSPLVSWDFDKTHITENNPEDTPATSQVHYYEDLVNKWTDENLYHLDTQDKSICLTRIFEQFKRRI